MNRKETMTLLEKINQDLVGALKAHDENRVSILRFLIAKLHNAKIAKGQELTDEEITAEIAREAKRHKESIEAYKKGDREDLVKKEEAELVILESYLPEQLSKDDLEKIIDDTIGEIGAKSMADLGRVMGMVMAKLRGKADGGIVSKIVRERLTSSKV